MRSLRGVVLVASVVIGLTTVAPASSVHAAPAAPADDPAPNTYPIVLSGDFTGDGVGDLFFHSPSTAPDVLYDLNPPVGAEDIDIYTYSVQGSYRPVVGQFGANGSADDIVWYQPGAAPDVIWDFEACVCLARPSYTRLPISVTGTYTPVAGHFFPGARDDIFWYGRGAVTDSIWDFQTPCASCQLTFKSRPVTVNGAGYQPVAGNFLGFPGGVDDVFWYNPSGPESIWEFSSPFDYKYTSTSPPGIQVAGSTYKLAVSNLFASASDFWDDIIFVGPGAAQDSVWNFFDDRLFKATAPEPLTGAYTAVTGVRQEDFEVPQDFFVYDPAATAGRYYDIFEMSGDFFYNRYNVDPAPLTEEPPPPVPGPDATAAAPKGRR